MQTLLKIAFSFGLLTTIALAIYGLVRLWTGNVNVEGVPAYLRERVEQQTPTLLRQDDALYQSGRIVGRVKGVDVKEAASSIHFEEITGTVDFLNPGADPIIFRRYRIQCTKIDSRNGTPPTPYVYKDVTCTITAPA